MYKGMGPLLYKGHLVRKDPAATVDLCRVGDRPSEPILGEHDTLERRLQELGCSFRAQGL